jgi:predicted Zn-dependent peptidase
VNDGIVIERTPGGLPVIVERRSNSHSASFSIYIGAGSRDEKESQAGIAHMLEHMLFKGTKNRTSRQMSEEIEAAGGEQNGYTTKEITSYQAYALEETAAVAEDILADQVLHPSLERDCLTIEKNVVVQEIRMLENNPADLIHVLFNETMWGRHPMGRSEAGSVASVSSLSESEVRSFFESNYRPPRMAVVAAGNIDPAQVAEWAARSFDHLEPVRNGMSREPPNPRAEFKVYPGEDQQAYVGMGFPGLEATHPDRFAQRMMSAVLGMGTSSRLFQEVRERSGLVYQIFASSGNYSDCGSVVIYFNTSVKDQEKVVRMIGQEIKRLKAEGLEHGELARAKHMVKGIYVRRLESTEARMIRLGEMFMATGDAVPPEETLRRMDEVTEEMVLGAAERLLDRRKLSMAMHAPGKESEAAAARLVDLDF